jgi:hypothetical protein
VAAGGGGVVAVSAHEGAAATRSDNAQKERGGKWAEDTN